MQLIPPLTPRARAGARASVDVEEIVAELQRQTQAEVLARLPSIEPRRQLSNLLPQYPLRAGHGYRPALCLGTCLAFGGKVGDALAAATALELFHNACLVHDDIGDHSEERRHRPSLNKEHGRALAMNAGSTLGTAAVRTLLDTDQRTPPHVRPLVLREFDGVVAQTLAGQAMDLGWSRSSAFNLDFDDYLNMVTKKTSWYTTIGPCRMGALIATRSRRGVIAARGPVDLDRLVPFGFYLGAAFQVRDDLRGHHGLKPGSDRDANDDLREGKRTLMLVHLLGVVDGRERETLRRFLARPREVRTNPGADEIREMMEAHGSVKFARRCLAGLAESAVAQFEIAFRSAPESPHKQFLRQLGPHIFAPRGR